jgi:hypothetical protein
VQRPVHLRDIDVAGAPKRNMRSADATDRASRHGDRFEERSSPCVSPIVASPTRSLTSTSAPRGAVILIRRLSVFGAQSVEKLNRLCQSQTDSLSFELEPSITTVPSSDVPTRR